MGDEQTNTQFRKQRNTQNLNEKSRILKLAFSVHNRHLSDSSVKEVINSKSGGDNFDNFKEIVDELEFEIVEHKASKQTDAASLDNTICFFEEGSFALVNVKNDASNLELSFKGKRNVAVTLDELIEIKKVRFVSLFPKFETQKNVKDRVKLLNPFANLGGLNFFWVALATFTSNVLGLATSIFIMVVYDRVLPNQADQSLYALAFGVGIAILFDQFFKAARGSILEYSAVNKDKKSNAAKFLSDLGNPYHEVLIDLDGTKSIEFGAIGVPETYLINNKIIVKKYIGPLDQSKLKDIIKIIKNEKN